MKQERFVKHISSAERRQARRAMLDMGIDLVSKTSGIKPSDREVLLENLLDVYVQVEITDMVNGALSPQALERVVTGKSGKPAKLSETRRTLFLERARTIFKRH